MTDDLFDREFPPFGEPGDYAAATPSEMDRIHATFEPVEEMDRAYGPDAAHADDVERLVAAALSEFPDIALSADIRTIVERSYAAGVKALDVERLEEAAAIYRILDADVPGARYTVANRHHVEAIAAEYQRLAIADPTPQGRP